MLKAEGSTGPGSVVDVGRLGVIEAVGDGVLGNVGGSGARVEVGVGVWVDNGVPVGVATSASNVHADNKTSKNKAGILVFIVYPLERRQ